MKRRARADLVIRNIGQLVTIAGNSRRPCIHPDESSLGLMGKPGSKKICVASSNGLICFVGYVNALNESIDSSGASEVDAEGRLAIPGFVDSHTHSIYAGSREDELSDKLRGLTYLEILSKGGGILKTMRDTRNASSDLIKRETRSRLRRMLSFGTTSIEVKSGYGLDLQNEIRLLRILQELNESLDIEISPTLLSAHAVPPEFTNNSREYVEVVVKPSIDNAAGKRLAKFCDVFMEEGVFGAKETLSILSYARSKGMKLKLHADEFSDLGGSALAAKLKVVSADHLMKASLAGIGALARSEIVSVLLPGTTFSSFAPSYANARAILSRGGPIALATDLSPGSWIESMQFVISLACFGMRLTVPEAIVASTINGAHAISRAKEIGSIEVGKKCDVLILGLSNYKEIPYRIATNNVLKVIKGGKVVLKNS